MALTQSQQAYYDGDDFGGYQVTSLQTIIDNFLAAYVGEGKLLQITLIQYIVIKQSTCMTT